jgi:hypothetical protein
MHVKVQLMRTPQLLCVAVVVVLEAGFFLPSYGRQRWNLTFIRHCSSEDYSAPCSRALVGRQLSCRVVNPATHSRINTAVHIIEIFRLRLASYKPASRVQ